MLEDLDALVDVEGSPILLVIFEDRERFVEFRLGGGLDSVLGFRDGGRALGFDDGLSHGASFYGADSVDMLGCWPAEIKNSLTSPSVSQTRAGGRLRRKTFP